MSTHDDHETHEDHPSRASYLKIAGVLGILTTVEVLLYVFRDQLGAFVTMPSLIVLTIGKFLLVVMWFMHLRFDNPLLTRFFVLGLILVVLIFGVINADFYLGSNNIDPNGF